MTHTALHDLQIIDNKITKLQSEQDNLEEKTRLDAALNAVGRYEKQAADVVVALEVNKKERDRLERSFNSLNDKIVAEEQRLYSGAITNPKELRGIEEEIISLKKKSDLEELPMLEIMEEIDRLDGLRAEVEELLNEARGEVKNAQADYDKVTAEIESTRQGLLNKRETALESISPDALKLYDRLRHEKLGLAVAGLDGATCGGCHMELPAIELRKEVGDGELRRCPHCRRILVSR